MGKSIIADRLKHARENKKLTQVDVYNRTGINNKTLSGYENDVSDPDLETLKILADLYEVSTDYLLGANENKKEAAELLPRANEFTPEQLKKAPSIIKYLFDPNLLPPNSYEVVNMVNNFESLPEHIQQKVMDALLIKTDHGTYTIRTASQQERDFFEQAKSLPRDKQKALVKYLIDEL